MAADDVPPSPLTVLVTGGRGFIGSQVVSVLLKRGHRVRVVSRHVDPLPPSDDPRLRTIRLDLAHACEPAAFFEALTGVDAVVNCAGILRETGSDRFASLHERMPAALANAAASQGIRRFVQVSALGDPIDGEFVASKHRGDALIARALPEALVLRPSLVYSAAASYGGSSMLRALAALPVIPLPANGGQRIQPLAAEDLALIACRLLEAPPGPLRPPIEIGGPEVLSLAAYLAAIRRWLGLGKAPTLSIPAPLARVGARLGDWSGRVPLGMTMWRMLQRGSVCSDSSGKELVESLAVPLRTLSVALSEQPASSADRWHARLYLLAPAMRLTLALSWIASGTVGLLLPADTLDQLSGAAGLEPDLGRTLGLVGSLADIGLGAALLVARRARWVLAMMLLFVVGYTAVIGTLLPASWLDPFGGLLKNGVIIVALLIAWATDERS